MHIFLISKCLFGLPKPFFLEKLINYWAFYAQLTINLW